MVVSELRGEKIDIIPYNDEPARFVAKALSPARVREVLVDDDAKQATVVVPDDQLSLAIGREGQNARLAARLTGWRIDIRSETEFAQEESEGEYEEEETSGRCAAILTSGRRCPNASLPGSKFCGVQAHQELQGTGSVYVGGEPPAQELADDEPDPEPEGADAEAQAPVEEDLEPQPEGAEPVGEAEEEAEVEAEEEAEVEAEEEAEVAPEPAEEEAAS
jgi:N utilization substance protein A